MFPETSLDIGGYKYIFNVKYWFHQNSSSAPRVGRMGEVWKYFNIKLKSRGRLGVADSSVHDQVTEWFPRQNSKTQINYKLADEIHGILTCVPSSEFKFPW